MTSKGFLTLVDCTQIYRRGDHYERMAKGLIRSVKQYDDTIPFAAVTDSTDTELLLMADKIIRPKREFGVKQNVPGKHQRQIGTIQKLYLDLYSPFDETIFIEADCLLYEHPDRLWQEMAPNDSDKPFNIQRQNNHKFKAGDSNFSIYDTAHYLNLCNLNSICHTIGGLIYFKKDAAAKKIFDQARNLYHRREELGLRKLTDHIEVADETLFATAVEMEKYSTEDIKDVLWQEQVFIMRTEGYPKVKVLYDEAKLERNPGAPRTLIAHYSATDKFKFFYLCQLDQLQWADKLNYRGNLLKRLVIKNLALVTAIVPYIVLQKRWFDYKWSLVVQRYKKQGLIAAIPGRIKKLFGIKISD